MKLNWDEIVPEEVKNDFVKWQQHLWYLEKLHIPRQVFCHRDTNTVSFHVLVDASQDAYAAALFARIEEPEGIYVQLIVAKVRVAPIERLTIPRLELLAVTIRARLRHTVKNALGYKDAELFF